MTEGLVATHCNIIIQSRVQFAHCQGNDLIACLQIPSSNDCIHISAADTLAAFQQGAWTTH